MTKDVALMFPGSGSQYVGMARWLYERYPQVRTLFDEASQITERDMAALCLSGTLVQLAEPTAMRAGYLYHQRGPLCRVAAVLAQTGVHVNLRYMLGHSLGEYAALTCSGALSFSQALALVAMRSRLASEIAREMDASTTIIKQGIRHWWQRRARWRSVKPDSGSVLPASIRRNSLCYRTKLGHYRRRAIPAGS